MRTTESEHDWFAEQIAIYLTGGLDPAERDRFESHERNCPPCAEALAAARNLETTMTQAFAPVTPAADFEDRLLGRLRLGLERTRRFRIHPLVRRAAVVAAAAVVLAGFGYVGKVYIETGELPGVSRRYAQTIVASNRYTLGQTNVRGANENKGEYGRVRFEATAPAALGPWAGSGDKVRNWSGGESWGAFEDRRGKEANEQDGDASRGERFGDAQVEFQTNPFAGVQRDMNRAARESARGRSTSAYDGNDKALLPTDEAAGRWFKPSELAQAVDAKAQVPDLTPPAEPRPPAAAPVAESAPVAGTLPAIVATTPAASRKVIREGVMEFEVDSFDSAYMTISKITSEEGGFVAATDSDKLPNGKVRGTVTLRVPPDRLDVLVLKLRGLGELRSQRLGSKDISKEYTDLESELRAARAMEERLLDMIKNAKGKVSELLEAEKELGNWRTRIEKIQGQLNYYSNLVSMATLTVTAYEKDIRTPASASQTEEINTGVETDDVEQARLQIIKSIDEAKGRIIESELKQLEAGQLAAKVIAEVPPDSAGPIVDRLRQIGKIARLDIQRKQVTSDTAKPQAVAPVRLEQAPTRLVISMYNLANVAPRRTSNLNLAAQDVEQVYRTILSRVTGANGRVLSSSLNRQDATQATGSIQLEVKAAEADAVLNDIRAAGQVLQLSVTENPDTQNVTTAKQAFTVQIIPATQVPPREMRTLSVQTSDVESAMQALNSAASGAGGRTIESSLSQDAGGRTIARLVFEVPLGKADQLVDAAKQQGKVRIAESTKNAQVPEGALSRARLSLTIGSGESIIPGERGLWTSIREGLSTSVQGLLWSLQLIVIGVCLVAPWVLLIWGGWKLARRRRQAAPAPT